MRWRKAPAGGDRLGYRMRKLPLIQANASASLTGEERKTGDRLEIHNSEGIAAPAR